MMPTDEHFEAVRKLREEARNLCLACTAFSGTSSLLHMALDRTVMPDLTRAEEHLVGKLRRVQ